MRQQPVAQPQRGDAVVPVVLGDLVELRLPGGRVPRVAQVARLGVLGDRVGRGRHLALPRLVAHVEGFELLQRVRAAAHPQAAAHGRVQVDEHAVAQQLVDRRPRRRRAGRPAGAAPSARTGRSGRRACRGARRGARRRTRGSRRTPASPARGRAPRTAGTSPSASTTPNRYSSPQSAGASAGTVSSVHSGSPSKSKKMSPGSGAGRSLHRARVDDLEHERLGRRLLPHLERRLPAQVGQRRAADPRDRVRCSRPAGRWCRSRPPPAARAASTAAPRPGGRPGARRSARRTRRTDRTPGSGGRPRPPGSRAARCSSSTSSSRVAALAVQRQQVGQAVARPRPVAQDQVHLVGHGDARGDQLVRVGRQLEQRGDLHAPGQLGVEHRPAARPRAPRSRPTR